MTNTDRQDANVAAAKAAVAWVLTITGMTVTEWAAVFACIYTILQIYVLVRDKLWNRRKSKDGNASGEPPSSTDS